MTNVGLNIGLKALLTSQSALDTVGHNLSNANTPGYSRQNLVISSSQTVMVRGLVQGNGVQADVVKRTVDDLLNKRLVQQTSALQRLDSRLQGMVGAEALFDDSTGNGIETLLQKLFGSFSNLAGDPNDSVLRTDAVQSALTLSTRFNQVSSGILGLGQDAGANLRARVEQVNVFSEQIAELNRQISSTEIDTRTANDLRDRREETLRQLAELVDTKVSENGHGALRVLVGGQPLVTPTEARRLLVETDTQENLALRIQGSDSYVEVGGGAIGGLMGLIRSTLPGLGEHVRDLAHHLILEMNRVHSTGISGRGPFRHLVGASAIADQDGDGVRTDELVASGGLPFEVQAGELFVNVTDDATGQMRKYRVGIDPERTTVARLLESFNAIPRLSASLDGQGRMQLVADAGYGFDFSPRLDAEPDEIGSFGGGRASLGSGASGPFALVDGDTLDLAGPLGPVTVTFSTTDFVQIGQATAAEIAAVINADPGVQANGLVASAVGKDLVLQTAGSGASESFTVTAGSALAALGWGAGTVVTGQDAEVAARFSGTYGGPDNEVYTFRPNIDGTIGNTQGLRIGVFDSSGVQVAELDVGAGYLPGDELDVLHGVKVSFELGEVSATDHDVLRIDVVADADTADLLPAFGLNSLFTGADAATMGVREDLELDPQLLAASLTGAQGDNGVLLRLLELGDVAVADLGERTFGESIAAVKSDVALDVESTQIAMDAEQFLLDSLAARRDQVSGVNVDEELVLMIQFEQSFAAASQYIRVISDLTQELLSII